MLYSDLRVYVDMLSYRCILHISCMKSKQKLSTMTTTKINKYTFTGYVSLMYIGTVGYEYY